MPVNVYITLAVVAVAIIVSLILLRQLQKSRAHRPRRNHAATAPTRKRTADRRHPPTSLTLLLARPLPLTEQLVASAVTRAWGAAPTRNESDPVSFVDNPSSALTVVQVRGNVFAVISIAEPYVKDLDWYTRPDAAPELVEAFQQHRAWLSVDLVFADPDTKSEDIYALIGKLLSHLADDSALAVLRPGKRHAIAFDDETRTLLRRSNPLQVVTGPLTSLVLLLETPRTIDTDELLALIRRAWNADLGSDPSLTDFAAAPRPPYGYIQYEGIRLGLITPDSPYVRDLGAALAGISDLRLRDAISRHRAWLSIDMVEAPVGSSRAEVYRLIARLIAELIDARALALLAPELQRATLITPDLPDKLRADNVLDTLSSPSLPPLISIAQDDPRLAAAITEARRRLPEFIDAFRRRRADQRFAIKRRFAEGAHAEFMWVRITAISPDSTTFTGTLDNDPYHIKSLKPGDPVSCPASDIIDWLYTDNATVTGNFTSAPLSAATAERSEYRL